MRTNVGSSYLGKFDLGVLEVEKYKKLVAAAAAAIGSMQATAVPFDASEYQALVQQAEQQKFVSVLVGLDVDASLPNFVE